MLPGENIYLNRKQCKKGAVLITATLSGIGAACAKNLAQDGFVVFAGVRNLAAGELLRNQWHDFKVDF